MPMGDVDLALYAHFVSGFRLTVDACVDDVVADPY